MSDHDHPPTARSRTSASVDRLLSDIDAALTEPSTPAERPILCARCLHQAPVPDGDLCHGCRSWLTGGSMSDPADRSTDEAARDEARALTAQVLDGSLAVPVAPRVRLAVPLTDGVRRRAEQEVERPLPPRAGQRLDELF